MLEAVPWENPTYGISGGAAGNVAQGGTVNPPRNRKGGAGNPPPKGARASALPDTAAQYEADLEANLTGLLERFKSGRYRHQPLRRVHIPKGGGRTRPIGISAVDDVQRD